ncbi:MAG: glycosyltransferase family 1 protein, partial [Dehalococcoidia bacterium]|nr:glycosyltransferase family 1 protein [Dehalococcoidia bacterium]
FVADEDIQYFLNGCEVCVLPYRTMTTSGAAILSLSFGKPVIAPRIGGFPCLLEKGGGLLYDPEGNGLSCALAQAREMDLKAASTRAFSLARGLDWAPIARQHLAVYEKLAGRSRAQQC